MKTYIYYPYVYKVTHKTSNQFYIGMRSANKVIAELDLGVKYFTSNKFVRKNFKDFNIEILAYFIDQESAFQFENNHIKENWENPLILNKHYQQTMSVFSMKGAKRNDLAEYNRKYKSRPKEFREYECVNCRDTIYKEEHIHIPRNDYCFCSKSCSAKYLSKTGKLNNIGLVEYNKRGSGKTKQCKNCTKQYFVLSENSRKTFCCDDCKKQYSINNPRVAWNKGIPNPRSAKLGKDNAEHLSKLASGRKLIIGLDGKKHWTYPNIS